MQNFYFVSQVMFDKNQKQELRTKKYTMTLDFEAQDYVRDIGVTNDYGIQDQYIQMPSDSSPSSSDSSIIQNQNVQISVGLLPSLSTTSNIKDHLVNSAKRPAWDSEVDLSKGLSNMTMNTPNKRQTRSLDSNMSANVSNS